MSVKGCSLDNLTHLCCHVLNPLISYIYLEILCLPCIITYMYFIHICNPNNSVLLCLFVSGHSSFHMLCGISLWYRSIVMSISMNTGYQYLYWCIHKFLHPGDQEDGCVMWAGVLLSFGHEACILCLSFFHLLLLSSWGRNLLTADAFNLLCCSWSSLVPSILTTCPPLPWRKALKVFSTGVQAQLEQRSPTLLLEISAPAQSNTHESANQGVQGYCIITGRCVGTRSLLGS